MLLIFRNFNFRDYKKWILLQQILLLCFTFGNFYKYTNIGCYLKFCSSNCFQDLWLGKFRKQFIPVRDSHCYFVLKFCCVCKIILKLLLTNKWCFQGFWEHLKAKILAQHYRANRELKLSSDHARWRRSCQYLLKVCLVWISMDDIFKSPRNSTVCLPGYGK